MKIKKIATVSALTLATSLGVTAATTAAMPTAAQASTRCSVCYGNTLLTGTFTFSARNVSVDWGLTAASGSGRKRASFYASNTQEASDDVYGAWVGAGTSGTGTLSTTPASQLPGGYGYGVLWLRNDAGDLLASIVVNRAGECF
jgi:hypothetical protein